MVPAYSYSTLSTETDTRTLTRTHSFGGDSGGGCSGGARQCWVVGLVSRQSSSGDPLLHLHYYHYTLQIHSDRLTGGPGAGSLLPRRVGPLGSTSAAFAHVRGYAHRRAEQTAGRAVRLADRRMGSGPAARDARLSMPRL